MTTTNLTSTRSVLKVLTIITAFVGVLYFFYLTRTIVVWMITALALTLAINPLVSWTTKFMPKKSRLVSALVVFTALTLATVGLGFLFVPPLISQTEQLIKAAPGYTQQLLAPSSVTGEFIQRYNLVDQVQARQDDITRYLSSLTGNVVGIIGGIFSSLLAFVTILGAVFFMVLEGPAWIKLMVDTIRKRERRDQTVRLLAEMYKAVVGYVAGKAISALVAGLTTTIMLLILGQPGSLPLGLLVGLLSLLPLVGATIGAVIVIVIALFTSVTDAIWLAVFFFIYQQFENNVLQPIIFNKTVAVSPLLVYVSVLFGTAVGGILGALIAIPVTACLQILIKDLYRMRTDRDLEISDEGKPRPKGSLFARFKKKSVKA